MLSYLTLFPYEKVKDQITKFLTNFPTEKKIEFGIFKIVLITEYLKAAGLPEEAKKLTSIIDPVKLEESMT